MGLLRFILRKDRVYSLLAGFTIFYVTWAFLTSQLSISSIPGEKKQDKILETTDYNHLINSDVTRRKLQKKNDASHARSSADQYQDDTDHVDTSLRQEEVEDSISPVIKIYPLSSKVARTNRIKRQKQPENALDDSMKTLDFAPQAGNALPNYFLHGEGLNNTRNLYSGSIVTYLHHNKAAGSSVKECLRKLTRGRVSLLDSGGRMLIAKRLRDKPISRHFYVGGYSFGICQQLSPRPCSYFTFVRDPFERIISSYTYCRRAGTDQLCLPGDPWKMDIKEWALFQGSFLFRQILFRPEFCSLLLPGESLPRGVPCWYREKVHLQKNLNKTSEDALIDFVVSNLEKWFAVIGMTEEYDASLAMLEEAYSIPFHAKCSGRKINVSDYRNMQVKSAVNETEHQAFVRTTKANLTSDEDVQRALRADVRIYEQAKRIFEKQRKRSKQIHDIAD